MAEYIKREYAVDAVNDVYYNTPDIDLSCEKFEAAILKIPATDVAPVRHARWKRYGKNLGECSECGEIVSVRSNYCPNCGCKMDLED